ncbi:hypothetical protein FRC06_001865, partial [Ceratobasidium sp. 370]
MNSTLPEFVLPPSDGSVPLDLAIDFHSKYNPTHVFAVLYNVESGSQTTITYKEFAQAVHRAAHALNPGASLPRGTNLGILISTDSILHVTLILGAIRAGLVPFPLSPRTQVEGIAHLFTQTQTSRVVTGGSPAIAGLYNQVESLLSEQGYKLEPVPVPPLSDIYPQLSSKPNTSIHPVQPFPRLQNTTPETTLVILHSSGSTGLPRPVLCDHGGSFKNVINQPMMKILGGPGARVGLMGLPTFHATGVFVQCMCSLYQGFTQVLFAPRPDPVVPTSDLTLESLSEAECESALAWPTFLEAWAQDENAISTLKKLRVILFGGGPLTERVGDQLVENGVNIQIAYAGTEFGACTHPCPPGYDPRDWIYFKFSDQMYVQLVPQHDEQGSHEVFFLVGPENKPFVLNSKVDGKPAYSTKDLVVPHPAKPGLWKLVGRADDQITLSNGEKINPGPMENTILKSPLVQFAAVFGREKSQTGVLIDLTDDARGTYLEQGRTEIVESIWPFIEQANRISPTHARLAKDTIIFTVRDRPIPRTPKGSVSRPGALKTYSVEIENMYAALEKSGHVVYDIGVPKAWTNVSDVEVWVRSCVENVLGRKVDVGGDLFQQGMDSLTAAILLRAIKG